MDKILLENWGRCFIAAPENIRGYVGEGYWFSVSSVLSVMECGSSKAKIILALIDRNKHKVQAREGTLPSLQRWWTLVSYAKECARSAMSAEQTSVQRTLIRMVREMDPWHLRGCQRTWEGFKLEENSQREQTDECYSDLPRASYWVRGYSYYVPRFLFTEFHKFSNLVP